MTIDEFMEERPGQSQSVVAAELGISRPFLNQLLNFQREPSRPTMRRIEENSGGKVTQASWFQRQNPDAPAPAN